MKKKNVSKESARKRMLELADIANTKNIKESKNVGLGTLISVKKTDGGINYGIIKENQNYYIKKGNKKIDPDASDFVYIGGLGNKTDYRYNTLSEADKNMNMLIQTINESNKIKLDSKSNKMLMTESEEKEDEPIVEPKKEPEDKIEKIEDKIEDLEDKTEKEKEPPREEFPVDDKPETEPSDELPMKDEPEEKIEPEKDIEKKDDDLEGIDLDDIVGDEKEDDEDKEAKVDKKDDDDKEIGVDKKDDADDTEINLMKSKLNKAVGHIEALDLEASDIKWVINTFLSAIENKEGLSDIDIEDRKGMADKIIKINDIDDTELADKVASDEEEALKMATENEEPCLECGDFTHFLDKKGYSLEEVLECDNDEMANNISEYLNAYNEGLNEGDFNNIGAYMNEEIEKSLIDEYRHDEYIKKLNECGKKKIYESDDDRVAQINELWGGLKGVGKWASDKIGDVGEKVSEKAKKAFQYVETGLNQISQEIVDAWNKGEFEGNKEIYIDKINKISKELGDIINKYNSAAKKADAKEINIHSIVNTIKNQMLGSGEIDVRKGKSFDESHDPSHVEAQPNLMDDTSDIIKEVENEEEIEPEKKGSDDFAPEADILGMDVVKPESTTSTDINVDAKNKNINISLNEEKIRKYVRLKLAEKRGLIKTKIDESKKSPTIKKLDEMIDGEYDNHQKETKLRKYVRNRLEEMTGRKKPLLNEGKKSDKLKKLDKMIAEQFDLAKKLHEGWGKKKMNESYLDTGNIKRMFRFFLLDKYGHQIGEIPPIKPYYEDTENNTETSISDLKSSPEFKEYITKNNIDPKEIKRIEPFLSYYNTEHEKPLELQVVDYDKHGQEALYDDKTNTHFDWEGNKLPPPDEVDYL